MGGGGDAKEIVHVVRARGVSAPLTLANASVDPLTDAARRAAASATTPYQVRWESLLVWATRRTVANTGQGALIEVIPGSRRFNAAQPAIDALPARAREACLLAGHTAARKLRCHRLTWAWLPSFPPRHAVALPAAPPAPTPPLPPPPPAPTSHVHEPLSAPPPALVICAIEVFARSSHGRLSDPAHDALLAITFAVYGESAGETGGAGSAAARVFGGDGDSSFSRGTLYVDNSLESASRDAPPPFAFPSRAQPLPARLSLPFPSEIELLKALVALVRCADPDALTGWDVQRGSWGFVCARAVALKLPSFETLLSRAPAGPTDPRAGGNDDWGLAHDAGLWIPGRIVINAWRVARRNEKLGLYTLEAAVATILAKRTPHFPQAALLAWWDTGLASRVLEYLSARTRAVLAVLDALDFWHRTAESARLYGVDFTSAATRGSQYFVEAVMLRVARPLGFVAPSPTRAACNAQAAMEAVPLIYEPAGVARGPIVVLDFQQLYPSIIIAYNLCFSTCLGKLAPLVSAPVPAVGAESGAGLVAEAAGAEALGVGAGAGAGAGAGVGAGPAVTAARTGISQRLGFIDNFAPPPGILVDAYGGPGEATRLLQRRSSAAGVACAPALGGPPSPRPRRPTGAFVAPTRAVFAPYRIRLGVLPRMLREILATRVMVKGARATAPPARARRLNARQLALKMIANVSYGYTAAGFSGRMPCAELADAIVSTARATLERAVASVEALVPGARVVYGDTDSLFVLLPGRTPAQAWATGAALAAAVTAENPRPVELKLEKVYGASVLVAKKRYAGASYTSAAAAGAGASTAVLDVKGLEIARRDSCAFVTRTQADVLRALLCSDAPWDLSRARAIVSTAIQHLFEGRVPIRDLIFAKEVRVGPGAYARSETAPPAAIVAAVRAQRDARAAPQRGERIPYVVTAALPSSRLVDMVSAPAALLRNGSGGGGGGARVNAGYYARKQLIPALDRVLSLAGASVAQWVAQVPKRAPGLAAPPTAVPVRSSTHGAAATAPTAAAPASVTVAASAAVHARRDHITDFFVSAHCALCGAVRATGSATLCDACGKDPQATTARAFVALGDAQRAAAACRAACRLCTGIADTSKAGAGACDAVDCANFWARDVAEGREEDALRLVALIQQAFD